MVNSTDIKNRIHAINQIRQITKAMYLLSATKIKRDSGWVELTRTYFHRVRSTMREILESSSGIEHRFLGAREGGRAAYIVIAGEKGLAGGYNHDVLNYALKLVKEKTDVKIIAIGQVTNNFFKSRGFDVNSEFAHFEHRPYLRYARLIVDYIFQMFDEGEMDEVYVVYTCYDSRIHQYPQVMRLLPINLVDYKDVKPELRYNTEAIYEPSQQEVFDILVPEFAIGLLFGTMVQSYISEHIARLNAMENATKTADEMIETLSKQYNMARQQAITQEITEIISASELLNSIAETD